jgi:hypothetical protein
VVIEIATSSRYDDPISVTLRQRGQGKSWLLSAEIQKWQTGKSLSRSFSQLKQWKDSARMAWKNTTRKCGPGW